MSVSTRLFLLIVTLLLFATLSSLGSLVYIQRQQKGEAEEALQNLARAMAEVVDREFARRQAVLATLATSPALRSGDLASFYESAKAVANSNDRTIVLSRGAGEQIINTRLPFRAAGLPQATVFPELRAQLNLPAEVSAVSDIYFAPVGKQYSFAVEVPVVHNGKVTYHLAMGAFASHLQELVADARLKDGWNAAILDRKGVLAARRLQPERFVGRQATDDMRGQLRKAAEGLFETHRLDGVAVVTAFAPIGRTGWTYVISMPRASLYAPLWRSVFTAIGICAGLLLLAMFAAWRVSFSITRPLSVLTAAARAMGRGELVSPETSNAPSEYQVIGEEMARASRQIRSASDELKQRVEEAVAKANAAHEALLQHRKLEALGRLTGGIAHDFNNLLQTMSISIELAIRGKADRGALEGARRAVQNATKLTRQLSAFGRSDVASKTTVDLREHLSRVQDILAQALRKDIELEVDVTGDLPTVEVDEVQLELALLNVALNARDAMPRGGKFRVRAREERESDGSQSRSYVVLEMSDTGTGMSEEQLQRAFEPFFTTKEVGKGSGLGLAQVYGFVTQSGGSVRLQSELQRGTTVSIRLPASTAGRPMIAAQTPSSDTGAGRGLRVLFVEDDPLVRGVVMPALRGAGFEVQEVDDVAGALAALQRSAWDIVFSDIVMPGGQNGIDLADALAVSHPEMPVLLATGYAQTVKTKAKVISKPYALSDLIQHLLDAARAADKTT